MKYLISDTFSLIQILGITLLEEPGRRTRRKEHESLVVPFCDALSLKKEQHLSVQRLFYLFLPDLRKITQTGVSQMKFEHLSILYSV